MFPDGQFVGPICPPEEEGPLSAYFFGFDSDGDGEIDRCYNPDDKLKVRSELNQQHCHSRYPGVSTPSTDDEIKIKAGIQEALDALNTLSAAITDPTADGVDLEKLNAVANMFNMNSYQDENFSIVSDIISSKVACIKPKLDSALLDPEGEGIRVNKAKSALGYHCYVGRDGVQTSQIEIWDLALQNMTSEIPSTLMHEFHHSCGGLDNLGKDNKPTLGNEHSQKLENYYNEQLQRFDRLRNSSSSALRADPIILLLNNTYYFDKILGKYL